MTRPSGGSKAGRKMKDPKNLDIKAVARKLRWPTKKWHGQCYAVACAIVKAKIVKGRAVYGHYTGPVAETGHWAGTRDRMFQRHGWIVLEDGRLLDPTRWSFEDKEPYFHLHDCSDHKAGKCEYDEGGNSVREMMMGTRPMPTYREPSKSADQYEKNRLKHVNLKLKPKAMDFLTNLFDDPPAFTWEMVHWVSNLRPERLGVHVKEIFQAIVDAGEAVSIPYDNRVRVLGE